MFPCLTVLQYVLVPHYVSTIACSRSQISVTLACDVSAPSHLTDRLPGRSEFAHRHTLTDHAFSEQYALHFSLFRACWTHATWIHRLSERSSHVLRQSAERRTRTQRCLSTERFACGSAPHTYRQRLCLRGAVGMGRGEPFMRMLHKLPAAAQRRAATASSAST